MATRFVWTTATTCAFASWCAEVTDYADVDATAARQWLAAANARTLIHGHTHRPAEHELGDGFSRVVLSDWDVSASPPRADVLRVNAAGLQRLDLASALNPAPVPAPKMPGPC